MTDILVALFIAGLLNLVVIIEIQRRVPGEEGRALVSIFRRTIALRYCLAFFLFFSLDASGIAGQSTFAVTFWGDSSTYDLGGYLLSKSWSGEATLDPYVLRQVSGLGFVYFVAGLYYVFGRNQILVQLLNGIIGGVTVLIIYAIAARLFDRGVARYAALFMAFFPQMIFWSAAMYKDPAVMFCIALSMFAVMRLQDRFSVVDLILFLFASLALLSLRFYIFYLVAFATLGTFIFGQRRGFLGSLGTQIVLLGSFLFAFSFAAQKETVELQAEYFDLKHVQEARLDQTQLARSVIRSEVDVSTPGGALAALPVGLVYLLFAPFPWSITSVRQLLTVPETLVWYSLMPAFARGLRFAIKQRFRACLPIFVFAGTLTAAYAVFQGNIGTAYRQRTQITMFFFIFMGVGIVRKERQEKESQRARALPNTSPILQRR
jgi:hypothetical protein